MSRRTQKNVGVIGLGIIGSRVADNLRRRGFHVFVWNRTPRPVPNFVGSRSEVADLCDFIQIFVSDDDALLETIEQLKRSLKAHHVVMAHSTVAPHTMRAAAEIVQRRGAQFLDAPFTGSKIAAEKGELVYYVAGDDAALQRARPVLAASSKDIVEIGEVGQATTVKIATNMITATTVQATAEALALVDSSGLSAEKFAAAMRGNAITSPTLALKLPKMMSGDFEPHFSVKHMLKDVQIASRLGRSYGLSLDATEAARESLRSEAAEGRGDLDFCSLIRVFFPEGAPPLHRGGAGSSAEQQTLGGLDEPVAPAEQPSSKQAAPPPPEIPQPPKDEGSAADGLAPVGETETLVDASPDASTSTTPEEVATAAAAEPKEVVEAAAEQKEAVEAAADADSATPDADGEERADIPRAETNDEPPETTTEPNREPEPTGAVAEPEVASSADPKPANASEQTEGRRGLFSRMFGKAGDY